MKSSAKDLIVTIGGTVGILGMVVFCAYFDTKYGVHTPETNREPVYKDPNPEPEHAEFNPYATWNIFCAPRSVTESKILAIAGNAKDYRYDSDRIRAGKDIYDLAVSGDDSVKQAAISALQEISKSMTYGSSRNQIFNLIKEI